MQARDRNVLAGSRQAVGRDRGGDDTEYPAAAVLGTVQLSLARAGAADRCVEGLGGCLPAGGPRASTHKPS